METVFLENLKKQSYTMKESLRALRTNLQFCGDDIKTISSNLGHATVAMTMDIYAHYTEDMRNDSSRRMQEYSERFKNL